MNRTPRLPRGLYAIADTSLISGDPLVDAVERVITAGAGVIQYRDKQSPGDHRYRNALALSRLCRQHDVVFIINDDIRLAEQVNADGVHLGKDDSSLAEARETLGDTALIGVSCYNQLDRAIEAEKQGADYVAFGRFFPSKTKPGAIQADAELLTSAHRSLSIPVVAIGGITPDNGGKVLDAGADLLAVIDGIFGQPDVSAAARQYINIFKNKRSPVSTGQ